MPPYEEILEMIMVFIIIVGTLVSLIITVQHLCGKTHRSYDPWLLPVFAAMLLQILGNKR